MVAGMHSLGSVTPNTGRRLALEWARLRTRPDAVRRAAGWALIEGSVDDLDQVLEAVGFETHRTLGAEQRLRRLVLLASDDELAGRLATVGAVVFVIALALGSARIVGAKSLPVLGSALAS